MSTSTRYRQFLAIVEHGSYRRAQTYYFSGNAWFLPAYGANGVHCTVVAVP